MGQGLYAAYAAGRAATSGYGSGDDSSLVTQVAQDPLPEDDMPWWKEALLYTTGAGYEFANDMLWGIPGRLGLNEWADSQGSEFTAGRTTGAVAALGVASWEAGAGMAAMTGGGAACLSGVGCVAGAPAVGVGAVAVGVSTGQIAAANSYLMEANGGGGSHGWGAARKRYWKDAAKQPGAEEKYGPENIERMKKGLAPQRRNPITGEIESKELHHGVPRRKGGSHDPSNLEEVWPDEHGAIDPYRKTGR